MMSNETITEMVKLLIKQKSKVIDEMSLEETLGYLMGKYGTAVVYDQCEQLYDADIKAIIS